MRPDDYEQFRMSIRVLGASYEQFIGEEHVRYYWSVLEDEPFDAVETLCSQFTRSDHVGDAKMPSAYQLRKQVHAERSGSVYELSCQQQGCRALIPWPSSREDEGRFFCPRHQPDHGRPASAAVKIDLLHQLTPSARAWMRSIGGAVAILMAEIPITEEERTAADAMMEALHTMRPRAFEEKAEGPGVQPHVFLNRPALAFDGPSDAGERRQIVAAAGWKYVSAEGVWRRGRYDAIAQKWRYGTRAITEDQIDRCLDLTAVAEFARRR
jgi:hypothetical protein